MRSPRNWLVTAALLVGVGLLLWFVFPGGGRVSYFGMGSEDSGSPWMVFMTRNRAIGVVLVWVGSLIAAGVIGHLTASRRLPSD